MLTTKGGEDVISIPTKWDNSPFYEHQLKKNVGEYAGAGTYKFAVTSMVRDVHQVMEKAGITGDQVKASSPTRPTTALSTRPGGACRKSPRRSLLINIDRYGNTSSASEPILLDEANRQGPAAAGRLCGAYRLWRRPFHRGMYHPVVR